MGGAYQQLYLDRRTSVALTCDQTNTKCNLSEIISAKCRASPIVVDKRRHARMPSLPPRVHAMIAFTIVVWALLKLCSANGCRQTGFAFKTTIPQRSMKWDREDCKTNCQLRHIDMVVHLNQITLAQQVPGPGVPWSWSRCSKGGGVCRLDNRVDWPVWENENKTCVCQVIVEFARWLDTDDKCKPDPNRALLEADLSMVRGAFTDFTTTWHSFDYHGNSWHWFRDAKHVKCSDPYAMDTCHLYGTCHGQFKIDHAGATGLDSDRDMIKYLSGNSHDPSESFPTQCDNEWKWP